MLPKQAYMVVETSLGGSGICFRMWEGLVMV